MCNLELHAELFSWRKLQRLRPFPVISFLGLTETVEGRGRGMQPTLSPLRMAMNDIFVVGKFWISV
jgi:hypothetical protein